MQSAIVAQHEPLRAPTALAPYIEAKERAKAAGELPEYKVRACFFVPVAIDMVVHAATPEDALQYAVANADRGDFPALVAWDHRSANFVHHATGPDGGAISIPDRYGRPRSAP